MSEKIDEGRRNFVLRRLPLIAGSGLFLPKLLSAEDAQAEDFEYDPYTLPTDYQLRQLLSSQRYPGEFQLHYEIPPNRDKNGNCLSGNFTFSSNPISSSIQIYLNHPEEHRLITLSETKFGDSIIHNENEINYLKPEEGFNNSFVFKIDNRVETPVSLAQYLTLVNPSKSPFSKRSFLFQGRREESQRYSLEIKTKKIDKLPAVRGGPSKEEIEEMGLKGLEGKIKGDSIRMPSGIVIYKQVDCIDIPLEIDLQYSVKFSPVGLFGLNYDDHTLKGVLQV